MIVPEISKCAGLIKSGNAELFVKSRGAAQTENSMAAEGGSARR